jgi:MoxR-like ATPase
MTHDLAFINEKIKEDSLVIEQTMAEMAKVIVGQKELLERMMIALLASGHILLEGVPGLAKTLAIKTLARVTDLTFKRIQFTPDLLPADLTGTMVFNPKTADFYTRKGPIFTNLLLADEINRAPAKTQSALLEVMQEYQVTIEGNALPMPLPFMTLATQNPIELEGTYPLPEAQLDRFLLKILVDYPSAEEERNLVSRVTSGQVGDALQVQDVATIIKAETVQALQKAASLLTVNERVFDYSVRIVRATRTWPGIAIGAGPRGSIALIRAARARALGEARDFVTPDDVKAVALPALRHRIALAPDVQLEGQTVDRILMAIVDSIEVPRS